MFTLYSLSFSHANLLTEAMPLLALLPDRAAHFPAQRLLYVQCDKSIAVEFR
jgi:hypothetical protein